MLNSIWFFMIALSVAKALTTLRAIMKNQMEFNILSPSFSQSFP